MGTACSAATDLRLEIQGIHQEIPIDTPPVGAVI